MRVPILLIAMLLAFAPARAGEFAVETRPQRIFGYFVGDLVRVRVEIRGPAGADLVAASLPRVGPLTTFLDLREVKLAERKRGAETNWTLDLAYQSFYVALDVRNVLVPGFTLSFRNSAQTQTVDVPPWSFGVAPLREITPEKQANVDDYLRPDGRGLLADDEAPALYTAALGALTLLFALLVARDRGWPPFGGRRARRFAILSRRLAAMARGPADSVTLGAGMRQLHRALDETYGKCLIEADLPAFFRARPAFRPAEGALRSFFAASRDNFFSGHIPGNFTLKDAADVAAALAERERMG